MTRRSVLLILLVCTPAFRSCEPAFRSTAETPWSEILSSYQETLVHESRRDYLVKKCRVGRDLASRIVNSVDREAAHYELDPHRILAVIIVESRCNPRAKSHKDALGLMQILPSTGRFIARTSGFAWSGVEELMSVESNIAYGTWYYQYLLQKFEGNDHVAVAAYNEGEGRIAGRLRKGMELPSLYPGKVYAVEQELRKDMWNEYNPRFWRGIDQYVRDAHRRGHSNRPEVGANDCGLPSDGGEGPCSGRRGPIPIGAGDLPR